MTELRVIARALSAASVVLGARASLASGQAESAPKHPAAQPAQDDAAVPTTATEKPTGILPLEDYSGDLWSRSRLTGDWNGARTRLAEKGIQFNLDFNQTVQSVVDGGRDRNTKYGGSLDYVLNFDLQRMDVLPGALVKFRAETRYGESANGIAGPILPVNLDGFMPLSTPADKDIPFTISDLAYYQFLSEKFALFIGKIDTLDGDPNEFASGRGNSQFLNANFVFSPVITGLVPYSTLGAGAVWMPSGNISVQSILCNTADASTTTGFSDIGDGWTWITEADFKYTLGRLPGGQNIGFVYAFDNDFIDLNGRFVFRPGEGIIAPTTSSASSVYWSLWQYLWTQEKTDSPIDLTNGKPDLQGIGIFARAGFADDDVIPIEWTASAGIGGRGLIPSRDNDTFGVGYYYTSIEPLRLSGILNIKDHTQGFEAFYNIAFTPAAHLTLDAQVVEPASENIDTGVVLGARLHLRF